MKYELLDISNFDKFNKQSYNKGVLTLNLDSWSEFHTITQIFINNTDYIWRGQEDNKPLLSSFDRYFLNLNKGDKQKELNKVFDNFKQRLRDLPDTHNINFSENYEIWAIGQHYGLPTPLLDWTECPYIGAYFAFYKMSHKNKTKNSSIVVVYALNRVVKRLILKEKNAKTREVLSTQRKIEFDFDSSHFAPEHHQRFINQKGAFTKAFKGDDIKSIVKEFWEKDNIGKKQYQSKIILAEILIPDVFHDECLGYLKSMNITHGVLFPDFAGAVDICKIDVGIDNICCNSKSVY